MKEKSLGLYEEIRKSFSVHFPDSLEISEVDERDLAQPKILEKKIDDSPVPRNTKLNEYQQQDNEVLVANLLQMEKTIQAMKKQLGVE